MTEVTGTDRKRAWVISEHCMGGARCAALDGGACDCGVEELREDIAAALAEERERARAPFLALADKLDEIAPEYGRAAREASGNAITESLVANAVRASARTVRELAAAIAAVRGEPVSAVCVHCGWFIEYEIPKAPSEPGWVHTLYRPDHPTRPRPCETPEPEEIQ